MIAAWMIYALAIGAIVSIAAVTAEWALKAAQRPVRYVWMTAIVVTTLLTVIAPFRFEAKAPTVAVDSLRLPSGVNVIEKSPTVFDQLLAITQSVMQTIASPIGKLSSAASAAPTIVNRGAAIAWFVSSVFALTLLIVVYARSRRESTRWPKLRLWGNNVRVAPDVGPAVIGMAPPEIVIPEWVLKRNEDEQRLVLQHEAEHVRAHDPLLLMIACVAVAIMPWHAALWFMWSRLRLAVELDCDRRVLNRGVLKPAYGELLVELSSQRPWNSLAMPAFSWGTSQLEKRIVAMTTRPAKFTKARMMVGASVVTFATVAACRSELPTATDIAAMDAMSAKARVSKMADSVYMIVDDKHVSEAEAKAIPAGDIASVEVLKRKEPGLAEVRIKLLPDSVRLASKLTPLTRDSASASGAYVIRSDSLKLQADTPANSISILKRQDVSVSASNGEARLESRAPADSTTVLRKVRLRSDSTNARQPLIIVDGVIIAGGMRGIDSLDPDRIESIEVIKGAAAQGLWGSRAADGVISIKLKK